MLVFTSTNIFKTAKNLLRPYINGQQPIPLKSIITTWFLSLLYSNSCVSGVLPHTSQHITKKAQY